MGQFFFFDLNIIRPNFTHLPICSKNVENKNLFISEIYLFSNIFLNDSYTHAFGEGSLGHGHTGVNFYIYIFIIWNLKNISIKGGVLPLISPLSPNGSTPPPPRGASPFGDTLPTPSFLFPYAWLWSCFVFLILNWH